MVVMVVVVVLLYAKSLLCDTGIDELCLQISMKFP